MYHFVHRKRTEWLWWLYVFQNGVQLLKLENRERGTQYDEALLDMEDRDQRKGSIKEALENVDGGYLYGTEKDVYNECLRNCGGDKEKARADYLFSRALCNVISNGRVVDSDD